MPTAVLKILSPNGHILQSRALIDTGAEASFASSRLAQKLGLILYDTHAKISGVGGIAICVSHKRTILNILTVEGPQRTLEIEVLVLPKLCSQGKSFPITGHQWNHLNGIRLADPGPSSSRDIDILIGSDVYGQLVLNGFRRSPTGTPSAQRTALGWIVFGPTGSSNDTNSPYALCAVVNGSYSQDENLDLALIRFWELENVPRVRIMSLEDKECERMFKETHRRLKDGRYLVRLPVRKDLQDE